MKLHFSEKQLDRISDKMADIGVVIFGGVVLHSFLGNEINEYQVVTASYASILFCVISLYLISYYD